MLDNISIIKDFINKRTRINNYTKYKRCLLEKEDLKELDNLLTATLKTTGIHEIEHKVEDPINVMPEEIPELPTLTDDTMQHGSSHMVKPVHINMQPLTTKNARQYDNRTRKELIQLLLERSCPPSMQSFVDRLRKEIPIEDCDDVGFSITQTRGRIFKWDYTLRTSIHAEWSEELGESIDSAIQEMKDKADATNNN